MQLGDFEDANGCDWNRGTHWNPTQCVRRVASTRETTAGFHNSRPHRGRLSEALIDDVFLTGD